MENDVRNLKIFSGLYIFLGVVDIVTFVIDYFIGSFSAEGLAAEGVEVTESMKSILPTLVIVLGIIALVIALVKIFMGIRGFAQANGKITGKAHVTVAKIMAAIFIVGLIGQVITAIRNNHIDSALYTNLASAAIIISYIQSAGKVKINDGK